MFTSASTIGVLAALVGASAYHAPDPASSAAQARCGPAATDIRRAQVELYCGHTDLALAGIRAARQRLQLAHEPIDADAVAALDRAAWLTRKGRVADAEQAMQEALARLQADARASGL